MELKYLRLSCRYTNLEQRKIEFEVRFSVAVRGRHKSAICGADLGYVMYLYIPSLQLEIC